MSNVYRVLATGYAYIYAGSFVASFLTLGFAALFFFLVIAAGLLGLFNM